MEQPLAVDDDDDAVKPLTDPPITGSPLDFQSVKRWTLGFISSGRKLCKMAAYNNYSSETWIFFDMSQTTK